MHFSEPNKEWQTKTVTNKLETTMPFKCYLQNCLGLIANRLKLFMDTLDRSHWIS